MLVYIGRLCMLYTLDALYTLMYVYRCEMARPMVERAGGRVNEASGARVLHTRVDLACPPKGSQGDWNVTDAHGLFIYLSLSLLSPASSCRPLYPAILLSACAVRNAGTQSIFATSLVKFELTQENWFFYFFLIAFCSSSLRFMDPGGSKRRTELSRSVKKIFMKLEKNYFCLLLLLLSYFFNTGN